MCSRKIGPFSHGGLWDVLLSLPSRFSDMQQMQVATPVVSLLKTHVAKRNVFIFSKAWKLMPCFIGGRICVQRSISRLMNRDRP